MEVAFLGGGPGEISVGLRDSKGSPSAVLAVGRAAWDRFLGGVRGVD